MCPKKSNPEPPNIPLIAISQDKLEKSQKKWLRNYQIILDASEHIIQDRGFLETTMDQIADKALISKTTIYNYFDRKEDIYLALGVRAYQKLIQLFEDVAHSEAMGIDLIKLTGWKYFEFAQKFPLYRMALNYSGPKFSGIEGSFAENPNTQREFQSLAYFQSLFVQKWMAIVEKGMQSKSIRAKYSAPLLTFLLGTMTTGFLDELQDRASILAQFQLDQTQAFEIFLDLIQTGIVKS